MDNVMRTTASTTVLQPVQHNLAESVAEMMQNVHQDSTGERYSLCLATISKFFILPYAAVIHCSSK